MDILFLTISLEIGSNDLYCDLIDSLTDRGHSVTVVRSNFKIETTKYSCINKHFKLIDVKTNNPFNKNLLIKGINQISIGYIFKKAIKKYLKYENFDLILYATPPITLANVIKYCKLKYNAKTFLMLKDIFPQNAVDLNFFSKTSIIYKYFRKEEKKYYKISDYIGCMSEANKEFILENNTDIEESKVHIFPNSINISNSNSTIFNDNFTSFIFGGNIGIPQNIDFLLNIIKKLSDFNLAKFIIVGDGTERYKVEKFIKDERPSNLVYLNKMPQVDYEEILLQSDVGIICLDPNFTIPNMPSKMQSYMKLRKPILALTDKATDLKFIILDNDCGWWSFSDDLLEATKLIKNISYAKEDQKRKGMNGYRLLINEYDVNKNVDKIEKFMKEKEI